MLSWQAVEFGEVGVSFSFTIWTLVSWTLLVILVVICAQTLRKLNRNDQDTEALSAIVATLANEQSELQIPETRAALREEISRRGWER